MGEGCCSSEAKPSEATPLMGNATTQAEYNKWATIVYFLAWFSMFWEPFEGLVAFYFGIEKHQTSLSAFGGNSVIEIISAAMVAWRLNIEVFGSEKEKSKLRGKASIEKERRASFTIGVLFIVLALGTFYEGGSRLYLRTGPTSTVPGLIISAVSWCAMFILYQFKSKGAAVIASDTAKADANCTFACMNLSMVVIVGSLLNFADPSIHSVCKGRAWSWACTTWWVDPVAGLLLGVWIAREGIKVIRTSMSANYEGGVPCCADIEAPAPLGRSEVEDLLAKMSTSSLRDVALQLYDSETVAEKARAVRNVAGTAPPRKSG